MPSTIPTFATIDQQKSMCEFIDSKIDQPFIEIQEFMHQVRDHFDLDNNLQFLDEFLDMARMEKKYEMTVPYKKLFDYGIPVTTRSDSITRSLTRANLIENRDYKVIRGIKGTPSQFTLTHDAFFRILQNADSNYKAHGSIYGTRDYCDFCQFVFGCVSYYSEYTNKYFRYELKMKDTTINKKDAIIQLKTNLMVKTKEDLSKKDTVISDQSSKIDRLEQMMQTMMSQMNEVSMNTKQTNTQLEQTNTQLEQTNTQLEQTNTQLTESKKREETILSELEEVKENTEIAVTQLSGLKSAIHTISSTVSVPHAKPKETSTFSLLSMFGYDKEKQLKYIVLREIRRKHADAIIENKKFLSGSYKTNKNIPIQARHKQVIPPITMVGQNEQISHIRDDIKAYAQQQIEADYLKVNAVALSKISELKGQMTSVENEVEAVLGKIENAKRINIYKVVSKDLNAHKRELKSKQKEIYDEIKSLTKSLIPKKQSPLKFIKNTITCYENDLLDVKQLIDIYLNQILSIRSCHKSLSSTDVLTEIRDHNDQLIKEEFENEYSVSMGSMLSDMNLNYSQFIERVKQELDSYEDEEPRYDPEAIGSLLPNDMPDLLSE